MAEPAILRSAALKTNNRGVGARTTLLVMRRCGSTSLINGIAQFDPGAATGLHFQNCKESVMIEGEAAIEIDGIRHHLGACQRVAPVPQWDRRAHEDLLDLCHHGRDLRMVASGDTRTIDAEHGPAAK
jgi:putative monooxygenase